MKWAKPELASEDPEFCKCCRSVTSQHPLGTLNANKRIVPSTYLYTWEFGAVDMILNKVLNTTSSFLVHDILFSKNMSTSAILTTN